MKSTHNTAEHSRVFRRLERSDLPLLDPLFQEVYGKWHGPSYWERKYFSNPSGKHGMFVLYDTEQDRLGGLIGGIPCRMKAGGRTVLAGQSCDITVHPDYSAGGSYFKLNALSMRENAKRDLAFIFGFGNPTTRELSVRFLGFTDLCRIEKLAKVLNPASHVAGKLPRPLRLALRASVAGLWGLTRPFRLRSLGRRLRTSGLTIEKLTRFDSRFDQLWARTSERLGVATVRDAAHLTWRYADKPGEECSVLALLDNERLAGYAVLQVSPGEVQRGRILDILTEEDDRRYLGALLAAAEEHFLRRGCHIAVCWMLKQHPLYALLRQASYRPRPTDHWLIVKPLAGDLGSEVTDPSRWYLTMGDSDYF